MFESVLRWWCRTMHNDLFHPVHGKYICGQCLREWPVPWAASSTDARASLTAHRQPNVSSDVVVTSPARGHLLIRLPIHSFRSTPDAPLAGGGYSSVQAGSQSQ